MYDYAYILCGYERFYSMLLLYTATMVWTSVVPRFSSGMSVTGFQSSSQPEKIEKCASEVSCHEKSS